MNHDLSWVQRTDVGYEAECGCTKRFVHANRDAVVKLHEVHAETQSWIAIARDAIKEGLRGSDR